MKRSSKRTGCPESALLAGKAAAAHSLNRREPLNSQRRKSRELQIDREMPGAEVNWIDGRPGRIAMGGGHFPLFASGQLDPNFGELSWAGAFVWLIINATKNPIAHCGRRVGYHREIHRALQLGGCFEPNGQRRT